MKVYTCFLLLRIFAYTQLTEAQSPTVTENQRSVNLALETVLEFSNKDNSADVKFLDNVQSFITKVKTVIDKNKNSRRSFRTSRIETLTDFIVEAVNLVDTFEDASFQDFYEILDEEIRKYHYRGCKFYELTENLDIRKFLADKLNLIKGKSVFVIKAYVNALIDIIKTKNYDNYVKELVDYINSLYRQDAREKFKEIMGDLEFYSKAKSKRSNSNMVRVVRNAIRTILFDYYTKLNPNARRALRDKIESFWKQYNTNFSTSSKSDNLLNGENDSHGKTDKPELSTPPPDDYRYKKESTTNSHKKEKDKDEQNEKRIEIKKTDYKKKKGIMRDGVKEKKVEKIKYTKIDTAYEDDEDQKATFKPGKFKRTSRKSVEHFSERSSIEELDRDLTGETLERNSIELYQKHQEEINTQRYMTLYPEPITYDVGTTEEPENIIHRSAKISTRRPILQTMWIEEATGRVPRKLIEKYNEINKKRHHVKHKPEYESHEKKHWPKKSSTHKSKHGSRHIKRQGHKHEYKKKHEYKEKHELKEKHKHRPKHKRDRHGHSKHKPVVSKLLPKHKKAKIFSQDHAFIDVATAMEFYEYKKMLGTVKIENNASSTSTEELITMRPVIPSRYPLTRRSPLPSRYSIASPPSVPPRPNPPSRPIPPSRPSAPSRLIIPNPAVTSLSKPPFIRMVTAPLELYSKRYEMLTGKQHRDFRKSALNSQVENHIQDKRRRTARRQSPSNISEKFDPNVEINVIKRINELEKELNKVKSKMNDIKNEESKLKKASDKLVANDKIENTKKYDIGLRKGSLRKDLNFDVNGKKDSSKSLVSQNKAIEYKTEYKFVKEKDKPFEEAKVKSTVTKNEVAETKTTKVTKKLETDIKKIETKMNEGLKKFNELEADNKVKLMIGNHGENFGFEDWKSDGQTDRGFGDYQDDVWKESFKFYMKPTTRSTTTKATKSTTRSENTTSIKSTKSQTISSMVELYISVPMPPPSTNKSVSSRKDTKIIATANDVANKNKTTKSQSEIIEPIKNITKEYLKNDITLMNNFAITTLSILNDLNDTKILSAEKSKHRKEVLNSAPQIWSKNNTSSTINRLMITDQFEGIDDGIEIPVK